MEMESLPIVTDHTVLPSFILQLEARATEKAETRDFESACSHYQGLRDWSVGKHHAAVAPRFDSLPRRAGSFASTLSSMRSLQMVVLWRPAQLNGVGKNFEGQEDCCG